VYIRQGLGRCFPEDVRFWTKADPSSWLSRFILMDDFLLDEGKLGHGFTSADELEKVDIGDGSKPRPMFISAKLDLKCK
jgi:hypothetical protein